MFCQERFKVSVLVGKVLSSEIRDKEPESREMSSMDPSGGVIVHHVTRMPATPQQAAIMNVKRFPRLFWIGYRASACIEARER